MGFAPLQIRSIVEGSEMPSGGEGGRQTMMFSATFPKSVRGIADSFLDDPVMLKVGRVGSASSTVTQKVLQVQGVLGLGCVRVGVVSEIRKTVTLLQPCVPAPSSNSDPSLSPQPDPSPSPSFKPSPSPSL